MSITYSSIKLIIWDLDDTFWQGTLSEENINPIPENIDLIELLTNRGIVNSICSKNDLEPTEFKLKELGILDYFVFRSINWEPKGKRISKLIKDMGLRPQNCLFIDDNKVNLNEAIFYEPQLMTMEPDRIPKLIEYFKTIPENDIHHKRLKSYKILEKKKEAQEKASDNIEFLYSSNTQVQLHTDCLNQIERIYELVNRTNQLNYTKIRSTKDEIKEICSNSSIQTGYVTVKDKFGDYGIVGFYAIKDNKCLHFLFSCRTIGQGVEQYVYAQLNYPLIDVIGEVVNPLISGITPEWINNSNNNFIHTHNNNTKIVIKGGCELNIMSDFFNSNNITTEFSYIGNKNNFIEHHIHSINYLTWYQLSYTEKESLLNDCIFNDQNMYKTSIYDKDVSLIFLSTMVEPNLGIYRNKNNGLRIAFGEYIYPLTEPSNWDLYINNKIFTANNHFTTEWLKSFSKKYEFIGTITPEEYIENIKLLLRLINPRAKICLLLGSEIPFINNKQKNYINRHLVYKEFNTQIRKLANINNRVLIIDFNEYISKQDDFTNNINHFQRRVYYEAAVKANEHIEKLIGNKLPFKNKIISVYIIPFIKKQIINNLERSGLFKTKLWHYIRRPYAIIKKILNRR